MRPDKKIKKRLYRSNGKRDRYGDKYVVKKVKPHKFDEDLPNRTPMSPNDRNYNSFKPLLKFLKSNVGQHWDKIYSEIVKRIPHDIRADSDPIDWYVSLHVIINEDKSIYDTRSHSIISHNGKTATRFHGEHFYVHPIFKVLHRLKQQNNKKKLSEKEIGIRNAEIKKQKAEAARLKKEKKRSESFENILRKKYDNDNGENFIG